MLYVAISQETRKKLEDKTGFKISNQMVSTLEIEDMIDILIDTIDELESKNKDLEQDIQDNYRPIRKEDQYE